MLKSMTAFGRGSTVSGELTWQVELRTVNSRFLDLRLRLPSQLGGLEERIKKILASRLSRGRVDLSIAASGPLESEPRLTINRPLLKEYQRVAAELQQELGQVNEVDLAFFLGHREIVRAEEASPDLELLWGSIEPALSMALDEALAMRRQEGAALAADLAQRSGRLAGLFEQAAARAPQVVEAYRQRLAERVATLLAEVPVDQQRLAMETAIMADKCDITEEAVRAASHLEQFGSFLQSEQPVGRKLDFLIQELNREANTMGSKLPDAEAAQLVVEIKSELERLREQVQNIE